jgi:hypothetical protein
MQTSDFAVLAFALAAPVLIVAGCLDGSTCLRNSDCPAIDVCSVGACILAPPDTTDEGGAGEAGTDDGATGNDAAPPGDGETGTDTSASDSGLDADATSDAAKSDAGDASDAEGGNTADANDE